MIFNIKVMHYNYNPPPPLQECGWFYICKHQARTVVLYLQLVELFTLRMRAVNFNSLCSAFLSRIQKENSIL